MRSNYAKRYKSKIKSYIETSNAPERIKAHKVRGIKKIVSTVFILSLLFFLLPILYFPLRNNIQLLVVHASGIMHNESSENFASAAIIGTNIPQEQQTQIHPAISLSKKDVRAYVLDKYFEYYNSPLYGYGETFVKYCDYYNAPKACIYIPAIAHHETTLCNYANSAEMHNCLGWGGGGIYRRRFNNFDEMIQTATDVLVNQYGNYFILNPVAMQDVFCGTQDECIGWGQRILFFYEKLDLFAVSLGVGRLTDLNG